jgi:hypothetical protein
MIDRSLLAALCCAAAPLLFGQKAPVEEPHEVPRELKVFTNSGTVDRIAKFASDGTTLVNSNIYDSGGYIGINTPTPWRLLSLDLGTIPNNGFRIGRNAHSTHPYLDVLMLTDGAAPYAMIQMGDDLTWRPLVLQPYGGNVGIRTTAPTAPLHLYSAATSDVWMTVGVDSATGPGLNAGYGGSTFGRGAAFFNARDTGGTAPNPSLRFLTADVQRMMISSTGQVGIGVTNTSAHTLDVWALQWGNAIRAVDTAPLNQGFGAGVSFGLRYNSAGDVADVALIRGQKLSAVSGDRQGKMALQVIDAAGNPKTVVELRPDSMTFYGNAHFNGAVTGTTISATYQDVAEWVPSSTDLEAGTVVVIDPELESGVRASGSAYDTSVAGVISAQPGISLGVPGARKEQVATSGRVYVKADASARAIAVGDLLVTSDTPGHAMRSTPLDVNGARIHRPGTIIGKALQPLAAGQGEILVLLSLQ